MAMDLKEIESLIKEALSDATVEIQDLAGDGNHYSATVTSSQFSGKSKIEQHKMVYNSLKGKMGNELHADEVILADEISPDTCRLWDALTDKKLDKDRFRQGLGDVVESYQIMAKKLGDHDLLFIVEQNRDGQMRTLIMAEGGIIPDKLVSILCFDGQPITAEHITNKINAHLSGKPALAAS